MKFNRELAKHLFLIFVLFVLSITFMLMFFCADIDIGGITLSGPGDLLLVSVPGVCFVIGCCGLADTFRRVIILIKKTNLIETDDEHLIREAEHLLNSFKTPEYKQKALEALNRLLTEQEKKHVK